MMRCQVSPTEKFSLVEHLDHMACYDYSQEELNMLLQVLLFLEEGKIS